MSQELKYKGDTLCPIARLFGGDGDEMRASLFGEPGNSDNDRVRGGMYGWSYPLTEAQMSTAKRLPREVQVAISKLICNGSMAPSPAFKLSHIDLAAEREYPPVDGLAAIARRDQSHSPESRIAFVAPKQLCFAEIHYGDQDAAEAATVKGPGNAHLLITARIDLPPAVCAALTRLVDAGYTLTSIANASTACPTMTLWKGERGKGIRVTLNWNIV